MAESTNRNIAKIGMFAAMAWVGYKIISGFAKEKAPAKIVKETVAPVEKVVKEVKKKAKRFVKGSPEAKAFMANLRAKKKPKKSKKKGT